MSEQVKDGRPGRFWMDDDVIDRFGSKLGAFGIAVYTMLCRRADKNGESYPSLRRMSEDLGISERQAKRELKKLRDLKLIAIEVRRNERGQHKPNVYTILQLPGASESPGFSPGASESKDRGPVSPPKEDPKSKEGLEELTNVRSSSGKPQSDEKAEEEKQTEEKGISLEKFVVQNAYDAMLRAGYRILPDEYRFHLGRAKDMLAKDKPTDEEIEALPEAFVQTFEIQGKADAVSALRELRRGRNREKRIAESRNAGYREKSNVHQLRRNTADREYDEAFKASYTGYASDFTDPENPGLPLMHPGFSVIDTVTGEPTDDFENEAHLAMGDLEGVETLGVGERCFWQGRVFRRDENGRLWSGRSQAAV